MLYIHVLLKHSPAFRSMFCCNNYCSLAHGAVEAITAPHTRLNYQCVLVVLTVHRSGCVPIAGCRHVNCETCHSLPHTCAACGLHRKRAELMRDSGEKPVEGSPPKRKKRESPRKKGKKQESSDSESGSDGHSPELSMAHMEVQLPCTPLVSL